MKSKTVLRYIWIISIGIILSSCQDNTDWTQHGLNGKVEYFIENTYEPIQKFGEWEITEENKLTSTKFNFNNKGKIKSKESYDKFNNLTSKEIYTYKNEELVERNTYDKEGNLSYKEVVLFYSDTVIEYECFRNDGEKYDQRKFYFENNRVVKQVFGLNNYTTGSVFAKTGLLEYDEKGHLIVDKGLNTNDEIVSSRKFEYIEYDKKNNWTKAILTNKIYNMENQFLLTREYSYY